MPGENTTPPVSPSDGIDPGIPWPSRIVETGAGLARRTLSPLRPRVSLASGSVLVLLTLFLPIGYESCGPEAKGYELLQGRGDWPTFLGVFLSDYFGPAFYGSVLLLAAWTFVRTLISLLKPDLLRNRSLTRGLFVASGVLSLFLISDVMLLLPMASDEYGAVGGALIAVSCLMPGKFWPRRIFWRWFGALAISASILAGSAALNLLQGDTPLWLLLGIAAIYALVPLALWWIRLSGRRKTESAWNDIRRGLIAFYFPAVLGNLWFFFTAWREGIWGFVPCCLGVHLMALGYMRLAKEAEQSSTESVPGGP